MHRYCKVLLGSAAAVALISGAAMLTTSEASAQQINIEGLIRGALSHSYGGYYRRHRGGRVHEVRHDRGSKDKDAKENDDDGLSKGKDDQKGNQSADIGSKDAKPANAPSAPTRADSGVKKGQQESAASDTTPSTPPPPAPPPKPSNEVPAFSPSR
jgi:hypothetical protein